MHENEHGKQIYSLWAQNLCYNTYTDTGVETERITITNVGRKSNIVPQAPHIKSECYSAKNSLAGRKGVKASIPLFFFARLQQTLKHFIESSDPSTPHPYLRSSPYDLSSKLWTRSHEIRSTILPYLSDIRCGREQVVRFKEKTATLFHEFTTMMVIGPKLP